MNSPSLLQKPTLKLARCVYLHVEPPAFYSISIVLVEKIEAGRVSTQQCIGIIHSNCSRDLTCSTFRVPRIRSLPLNPCSVARVFHFRPLFFSLATLASLAAFGTCHPERYMQPTQVRARIVTQSDVFS